MARPTSTAMAMADAAATLLAALDPAQHVTATFEFDDDERRRFFWTPTDHGGLSLRDCDPRQRVLVMRLVATGLSAAGFNTAATIIAHQVVLARAEEWRERPVRDPADYQLALFGEPSPTATWGWRIAGHHLSLSYAIVGGDQVRPTPSFFGADPDETPLAGSGILRPLGRVGELGRELARSFDELQLSRARLAHEAPPELVVGNQALRDGLWSPPPATMFRGGTHDDDLMIAGVGTLRRRSEEQLGSDAIEALRFTVAPKGLSVAAMAPEQREILHALVTSYLDRLPDDVADGEHAKVLAQSDEGLRFAWAGPLDAGKPHYYRVHGPRVLIEYDNVDGNHSHSVWRDPLADFGEDVLARHYDETPHHR